MAKLSIATIIFSEIFPILFYIIFILNLEKLELLICNSIDLQICKDNIKKFKVIMAITIAFLLMLLIYYL